MSGSHGKQHSLGNTSDHSDGQQWTSLNTLVTANSALWSGITRSTFEQGATFGPSNSATLYLSDSATVWDDLVLPITIGRAGGVAPQFLRWGAGGLYVFKFDNNDEMHFCFQMPHRWKEGTIIYPHLHWCQDNGTASPGVGLSAVRWNFEVSWAGLPNGLFKPSSTLTYWSTANVTGPNTQILQNFSASGINPLDFGDGANTLSSVIVCRLYRGGTGDTYGATRVNGLSIDIHHEIDSLGSQDVVTKWIP